MQCSEESHQAMDTVDARPAVDEGDAKGVPGQHAAYARAPIGDYPASGQKSDEFSFTYNMNHARRGMAIIINNRDFDSRTGMSKRNGSDTDAANLYQRLKTLQFEVPLKTNLTTNQMLQVLTEAGKLDHTDADCFVCTILSHGEEGRVYGTDGVIAIETLTENFKGDRCRSLAGKPKIFFIQACRGNQLDHGVEATDAMPCADEAMDTNTVHRIPSEADFLMAYSVVPGYFSWRNSTKGSWFIQALCLVLEKHAHEDDILKIMTRVNQKVAYDFESNAAKEFMNRKKQIPCVVSMLTKQLYFAKK